MSRIKRLKEYAAMKGPAGASTQKNIDYWANRASENSAVAPRAKGGGMKLPSTGGDMKIHDTSAKPSRKGDPRKAAKQDLNFTGSSTYMPNVRRGES